MIAPNPLAKSTASVVFPFSVWDDFELTERPPEQAYFWTSEWQEGEQEADEDIKAGRTRRFSNAEEAMTYLHSLVM